MKSIPDRVWVEINLDHILHNFKEIKEKTGPDVRINAIIKADGYGHGAVETARLLSKHGADMFSVATLDEALQLRRKKISTPILVLGYILNERIDEIIEKDITISIFDVDMARSYSRKANERGGKIKVHLKVDTGMNRIGFHYTKPNDIYEAFDLKGLEIEGIFTHFSKADEEDKSYTHLQYERFKTIISDLTDKGIEIPVKHACNSGGVILHDDKYLNMVRPGIILYGLYPSAYSMMKSSLNLKRAMTFKSRIIEIKEVESNEPVSYGGRFVTTGKTKIATIACGYADGYSRQLTGKAKVLVNGDIVPVIGNICMDMCMADITNTCEHIKAGDEVILFDGKITIDTLAEMCGTINYEFICKIGMRVPRVYIKNNRVFKINNYLLK